MRILNTLYAVRQLVAVSGEVEHFLRPYFAVSNVAWKGYEHFTVFQKSSIENTQ